MSKLIFVLSCCIGCVAGSTGEADKQAQRADCASDTTDNRAEDDIKREEQKLYTFRLPMGASADSVSGFEVLVRAESPQAAESYKIEVFAVQVPGANEKESRVVPLGGHDVFRPLKKDETTIVFLDAPSQATWWHGSDGEQLKLGVRVQPANPKRTPPKVALRIVDVKPVVPK